MPSAYCTAADLELPAEATSDLDSAVVTDAIAKASAQADTYIAAKYTLPLHGTVDPALNQAVAAIATYRVMKRRGYSPQQGDNEEVRTGYTDAIKWLQDVSAGKAEIQMKDSDSDAQAQEGTGPSSSPLMLQPGGGPYGVYDRQEDFWHDCDSVGTTGEPRKRGW